MIPIPRNQPENIGESLDPNAFVIGSPPVEYALLRSIKDSKNSSNASSIRKNLQTKANSIKSLQDSPSINPFSPHMGAISSPSTRIANPADPNSFRIRICSGRGNLPLAENIVKLLNLELEACNISAFADGELNISIENNVRGSDVYIIQPMTPPDVHTHLMELLLLIHTLHLSSAKRITAIIPYFAYSRQDRKILPRTPISASAVAQLIESMRPHQLVMVDLHHGQIQGFFQDVPTDNLIPEKEFLKYCLNKGFDLSKTVIVSPDAGGVYRAKSAADALRINTVVTILKRKIGDRYELQLAGDVSGLTCIIIDDIIGTGDTIIAAAQLLKEKGASEIYAFATHGVFSDDALEKINESSFNEVCVTDSLPQQKNLKMCPKLRVFSLANLLAEVIERLHFGISLANLRSV